MYIYIHMIHMIYIYKLYYIILYCITLYCIILYYIVLYCIILYYIVLYCIILYYECVVDPLMEESYFGFKAYFLQVPSSKSGPSLLKPRR